MKRSHWFSGIAACFAIFFATSLFAQNSYTDPSKTYTKNVVSAKLEDSLKQQFKTKRDRKSVV